VDLTLSIPILAGHRDRHEVLWYAPGSDGGRVYWADAAAGDQDTSLAYPADLLMLAPEGEVRTFTVDVLGWSATDHWAVRTWLDDQVDLIIIEGFPHWPQARLFGPLQHGAIRPQLGGGWAGNSLACLPGGLWRWTPADGPADISTSWRGAMGMML